MANIVASKYKSDSVNRFIDSFETSDYYIFVSSANRTTAENTLVSENDFLQRTIFGKKVENVHPMIRNYVWSPNLVFDQYDDNEDMTDKRFYTVVFPENSDTSDYRIYKCLSNANGATTISPPNYNPNTLNQIYPTGDGYVWKYMYSLNRIEFEKFNALGYIPVIPDEPETEDFVDSEIDKIIVENVETNQGYDYILGEIDSVVEGPNNTIEKIFLRPGSQTPIESFQNYYSNQYLYITAQFGSDLFVIDSYLYDVNQGLGVVTLKENPTATAPVRPGSAFRIFPQIEIKGDGSGAVAIPQMDGDRIVGIQMIQKGSGYNVVEANVVQPFGFNPNSENTTDVTAVLRPVMSPQGGHGSNIAEELLSRHCLVYAGITREDNEKLPTSNFFSKVGLVKDPEFFYDDTSNTAVSNTEIFETEVVEIFDNRIKVEVESVNNIQIDTLITQVEDGEVVFEARVHDIEVANTVSSVYLSEYNGPYQKYLTTDTPLRPDLPLVTPEGELVNINTINDEAIIEYSQYVQRSGEVYYMNDFTSIERTNNSTEQFKIVLEF